MSVSPPTAIPHIVRTPAHPSITPEQISLLVDRFYDQVRRDERLGPIFAQHIDGEWPEHLKKMKSFWRSVLLKTGEYKGRPVPVHAKIEGVTTGGFRAWLKLFEATVVDIFEPEAQPIIIQTAERIASSLWLAMNSRENPFASPPDWSAQTVTQRAAAPSPLDPARNT